MFDYNDDMSIWCGLYLIQDKVSGFTTDPFACRNDATAKRNFIVGCARSDTPIGDCQLYKIGSFSYKDGKSLLTDEGMRCITPCISEIAAIKEELSFYFDRADTKKNQEKEE